MSETPPDALALLVLAVGTVVMSVAVSVFLASLRAEHALSISDTYRVALRRLPRIIGISILWALAGTAAWSIVVLIAFIAIVLSPWLLLLLVPLVFAAFIYFVPFGAVAVTALGVGPSDDPPFRRTIALVKPNWGPVALRLLVLTLVFFGMAMAANLATSPFGLVSVWAGVVVSLLVQAVQSIVTNAGNVVLYEYAGGTLDPALTQSVAVSEPSRPGRPV